MTVFWMLECPTPLWFATRWQTFRNSARSLCEDFGVQTAIRQFSNHLITIQIVTSDCIRFGCGLLRNRTVLLAENLFLRKQLVLFQEREERARQTTAADRFIFAKLAPDTSIRMAP